MDGISLVILYFVRLNYQSAVKYAHVYWKLDKAYFGNLFKNSQHTLNHAFLLTITGHDLIKKEYWTLVKIKERVPHISLKGIHNATFFQRPTLNAESCNIYLI